MDHWTGQSFLASFIIRLLDGVVVPVLGFGQGQIEPLPAQHRSVAKLVKLLFFIF